MQLLVGNLNAFIFFIQNPPQLDAPVLGRNEAEKEVKAEDPGLLDLQTNVF